MNQILFDKPVKLSEIVSKANLKLKVTTNDEGLVISHLVDGRTKTLLVIENLLAVGLVIYNFKASGNTLDLLLSNLDISIFTKNFRFTKLLSNMSLEELKAAEVIAVNNEDYERAAVIRDLIIRKTLE